MTVKQRLIDFARWQWKPENMMTSLRGSIALLLIIGFIGIGRGVYKLEPASFGVGLLFLAMAGSIFFGGIGTFWNYWAPLIKRRWRSRKQ